MAKESRAHLERSRGLVSCGLGDRDGTGGRQGSDREGGGEGDCLLAENPLQHLNLFLSRKEVGVRHN